MKNYCSHTPRCEEESDYCNHCWSIIHGHYHVDARKAPFTRAARALKNGLVFREGFKIFLEDDEGIFQTIIVEKRK